MRAISLLSTIITLFVFNSCDQKTTSKTPVSNSEKSTKHLRHIEDTLGFAQYAWQMDSIMARIDATDKQPNNQVYKAVINPHDDYAYAGGLYAKTLSGIKAHTIVMIGVAHRARNFDLKNKVIFGSYDAWESPFGSVKISVERDALLQKLNKETYLAHDKMMQLEHSLEAIVPFLQYQQKDVEIIPMLIPYMTFENMTTFSEDLSNGINEILKENNWEYGKDLAIIISNDAIHYGNDGWGGGDLAPFGVDEKGNNQAKQKDLDLISATLEGEVLEGKIKHFNLETVQPDDFMQYKWTWCGRYSVPFGLLVANKLNKKRHGMPLQGTFIDYRSSIHNPHIEVEDIGMGHTASANNRHWVAYLGMSYQ